MVSFRVWFRVVFVGCLSSKNQRVDVVFLSRVLYVFFLLFQPLTFNFCCSLNKKTTDYRSHAKSEREREKYKTHPSQLNLSFGFTFLSLLDNRDIRYRYS